MTDARRSSTALRRVAAVMVVLGVSAGPLGRAVVRLVYEAPPGGRISGLIAGGSRERGLDEYLTLLSPLTTTVSVWAAIIALLLGLMAFESPGLWERLARVRPSLVLTVVHLVAWGLLLLSAAGVYWDDWSFYARPLSETFRLHAEGGRPLNNLYDLLVRGFGATGLSLFSLVIHLLVGLGFFAILERCGHGSRGERVIAAAVLLAAPLNAARQTYAVFQYTFSLGLLIAGWYLLIRSVERPRRREVGIVAVLLALASFTPSIGLFTYIVLAHVALSSWSRTGSPAHARHLVPLLPIPALVVAIDQFVLVPSGAMEEYNTVDATTLVAWGLLSLIVVAATGAIAVQRYRRPAWRPGLLAFLLPTILGTALIVASLLPYAVVGRTPQLRFPPFGLMGTRHELLVGFGFAVLVVGLLRGVRHVSGRHVRNVTAVALIVALALQSAVISASYWVEYQKQTQFMSHISRAAGMESLDGTPTVLLDDRTADCNALTRNIRPDEWEAQIRLQRPGFAGRVILDSVDRPARHDIDVIIVVRNLRNRCEVTPALVPLWTLAGLPRLVRLPKLVIVPPDLEIDVSSAG